MVRRRFATLQAKMPALQSAKININVIGYRIARIVHLLETPITALPGYLECEFAVARARLSAIDVADLRDYRSAENKILCIDGGDGAVDPHEVRIIAPGFLLAFDRINSAAVYHGGDAEVIPAYPLERELVTTEEHAGRGSVVDVSTLLADCHQTEEENHDG